MKFIPGTLLVALLVSTCAAQAGVIVGGTRLIYDGARKESSPRQTAFSHPVVGGNGKGWR